MRALWALPQTRLITCEHAVTEARRNLPDEATVRVLDALLREVLIADQAGPVVRLPGIAANLPEDDKPILESAISIRASHLLTGNDHDFGMMYGRRVVGVLVLRPSTYLAARQQR